MEGRKTIKVPGFMFVCDAANVDTATGKLNAIGIFDRIRARTFPFTHPSCAIVAKVACNEGKHTAAFYFKDADDRDFMPPCKPVEFESPPLGTNTIVVEIKGLRFPKEGFYEIQLFIDDAFIDKTELVVSSI